MGALLNKDLFSGSIDASLEEIDARSHETTIPSFNDIRIGPFAVLSFNSDVREVRGSSPGGASNQIIEPPHHDEFDSSLLPLPTEPLDFPDDPLQWSDIFGLNDGLYGITSNFSLDLTSYPDFSAYPDWLTYEDRICDVSPLTPLDPTPEILHASATQSSHEMIQSQQVLPTSSTSAVEMLIEAPFLLHIFQKHVVPQLTIVPFGNKASWCLLNVPAALVTLGDLTILESQDVSHARQANLYSLLTSAAIFLAMRPSADLDDHNQPAHWQQIANRFYHEAKHHTLIYMKEPIGTTKAKYKDRIMAIFGMIEAAVRNPYTENKS